MILLKSIETSNMNQLVLILIIFNFLFSYESLDFEFLKKSQKKSPDISNNSKKNTSSPKSFEKLIEGSIKKEGLFDYYWNENKWQKS